MSLLGSCLFMVSNYRLNKTAKEVLGIDNYTDMIADETIAEDADALLAFLQEKHHPVLNLEPLM